MNKTKSQGQAEAWIIQTGDAPLTARIKHPTYPTMVGPYRLEMSP